MKKISFSLILCCALQPLLQAQLASESAAAGRANAPGTNYTVVGRSANSRVWGTFTYMTNQAGKVLTLTNPAYTEVAANVCVQKTTGEWVDSDATLDIADDGVTSSNSPLAVRFSGSSTDPNWPVHLTTKEGHAFVSSVWGIGYYDSSQPTNLLISKVRAAQGYLIGDHEILYSNCFSDIDADIRYSYSSGALEQFVILHEAPASPTAYGLNPQTTMLQVFTEWSHPPQPAVTTERDGDITHDAWLDFGGEVMGPGSAFFSQGQGDAVPVDGGTVYKHWLQSNGSQWLIEEIRYPVISNLLQTLPLHASVGNPARESVFKRMASSPTPQPGMGKAGQGTPIKIAKAAPRQPGLVVDYNLSSSVTNYTFAANVTYYLPTNVLATGTCTTFEGASCLKFSSNATLTVNTPVTWTASAYHPVILTAKSDSGVGGPVSGSNPGTTYYANTALYFNGSAAGTNLVINHLRVMNALTAVAINGNSNHVLSDVQMVNCGSGLAATNTTFSLWNGLMTNVMTNFTGSGSTGDVEQLTADASAYLNVGDTLGLTNCLLYRVTNATGFTSNAVYSPSGSGIFQGAGLGAHYLAAGSPYLNAGTTNINPRLAATLANRTTFPPVLITTNLSGNTTLWPQAQRGAGAPSCGYYYDPLDYLLSNVTVNSGVTLLLTNGVAVGTLASTGLTVNGNLASQGTPLALNQLVPATVAQEGFSANNLGTLMGGNNTWQSLNLRFTDLPMPGGSDNASYGMYLNINSAGSAQPVVMQDCQLTGGCLYVNMYYSGAMTMTLFNNLFSRAYLYFLEDTTSGGGTLELNYGNNLLHLGTISLSCTIYASPYENYGTWTLNNNLFENSTVTESGSGYEWQNYVVNNHNAYVNATELQNSGGGDLFPSTADYQTGALGGFYYPTNGSNLEKLVHTGGVLASAAGLGYSPAAPSALYHYTVTTNNVIEGANTVSIGFHYIAVDANGNPLSTSGDGIPDYLKDANGNGVFNSGDPYNWLIYNSLYGLSTTNVLQVFTPLK